MKTSELIKELEKEQNNYGDLDIVISAIGIDGFGGYMSDGIKFQISTIDDDEPFLAIEANYNMYSGRKKKTAIQFKEQVHEWARLELKKWGESDRDDSRLIEILSDTFEKLQKVLIKKYDIF